MVHQSSGNAVQLDRGVWQSGWREAVGLRWGKRCNRIVVDSVGVVCAVDGWGDDRRAWTWCSLPLRSFSLLLRVLYVCVGVVGVVGAGCCCSLVGRGEEGVATVTRRAPPSPLCFSSSPEVCSCAYLSPSLSLSNYIFLSPSLIISCSCCSFYPRGVCLCVWAGVGDNQALSSPSSDAVPVIAAFRTGRSLRSGMGCDVR